MIRAFAKINLDLRVGPLRPDGYHDVRTVLQSVGLHDTLTFARARGPLAIECDAPGVPRDRRNLVWRAAALLHRAAGRRGAPAGVRVALVKRVPAAAGLGGGSSDAAATLVALARLWGLDVDLPTLIRLAAELGADVPFFLAGGTALGTGRGDELTPLAEPPPSAVLLVRPPFGVSTPDAYRWFDDDGPSRRKPTAQGGPRGWPAWADALRNDLEPPVSRRHVEILRIVAKLRAAGATLSAMSGSGSAVFGVFPSHQAAVGARNALRDVGAEVWLTRTVSRATVSRERRRVLAGR